MAKKGKRWGKKIKYIRNWPKVNKTYVQRGIYYLDLEWVQDWDKELAEMNKGKRGAKFKFPNSLIHLQSIWTQFHSYRVAEGITIDLVKFSNLPESNNYTTIFRRVEKIETKIPAPKSKEICVATDGTGVKMGITGEYLEDKYGDGRKKYIKVVISGDPNTKDLLKVEVSVEGQGISEPEIAEKHMKELIDEGQKIKKFYGDGGLDKNNLFDFCDMHQIDPVIKLPKNAVDNSKKGSWRRSMEVRKYKKEGYKKWAKKRMYGMRWPGTEGIISAVKTIFGERIRSKKEVNKCAEAHRRFWAYQVMKRYAEDKLSNYN
jgi:hypothetical protein